MRYGVLVLNTCLSEEKAERLSIVGYGVNPVGRPDATNKQTNKQGPTRARRLQRTAPFSDI